MLFVVPFDGSDLAHAALARAATFGSRFDATVRAVAAVPRDNARYARERGWLDPDAAFDRDRVREAIGTAVRTTAPDADVEVLFVDRHANPGTIATRLRTYARQAGADMVFIGSDNAGRIVRSVSSVGAPLAADDAYDVVIVRGRLADPG